MSAEPGGIRDLFSGLGDIATRRMMGGLVVRADGRLFAAADREGALHLRTRGPLTDELRAMGGRPFVVARAPTGPRERWAM